MIDERDIYVFRRQPSPGLGKLAAAGWRFVYVPPVAVSGMQIETLEGWDEFVRPE